MLFVAAWSEHILHATAFQACHCSGTAGCLRRLQTSFFTASCRFQLKKVAYSQAGSASPAGTASAQASRPSTASSVEGQQVRARGRTTPSAGMAAQVSPCDIIGCLRQNVVAQVLDSSLCRRQPPRSKTIMLVLVWSTNTSLACPSRGLDRCQAPPHRQMQCGSALPAGKQLCWHGTPAQGALFPQLAQAGQPARHTTRIFCDAVRASSGHSCCLCPRGGR